MALNQGSSQSLESTFVDKRGNPAKESCPLIDILDHFFICQLVSQLSRVHTEYSRSHVWVIAVRYVRLCSHLLRLVDACERCHLTVFVISKYLAHGTRGNTVGHAIDIDLFFFMNLTHGCLLLLLWYWLAAANRVKENSVTFLKSLLYFLYLCHRVSSSQTNRSC